MEIKSRLKALATFTAKSTCLQETSEIEEITTAPFATETTDSVITLVFSDAIRSDPSTAQQAQSGEINSDLVTGLLF